MSKLYFMMPIETINRYFIPWLDKKESLKLKKKLRGNKHRIICTVSSPNKLLRIKIILYNKGQEWGWRKLQSFIVHLIYSWLIIPGCLSGQV